MEQEALNLYAIGRKHELNQRLVEAEKLYVEAAKVDPSIDILTSLARVQLQLHHYADAEISCERILLKDPKQSSLSVILAKIKQLHGDAAGAIAVLGRAQTLDPLNSEIAMRLATLLGDDDAAMAVHLRAILKEVANDPAQAGRVLRKITELNERTSRQAVHSWEDVYGWHDASGLEALSQSLALEASQPTMSREAAVNLGCVAIAQGDWTGAEHWFGHVRAHPVGDISDAVAFNAEVTQSRDLGAGLPPIAEVISGPPTHDPTLFLASDPKYFQLFTLPLLEQLNGLTHAARVHVHILDGDANIWREIAVSVQHHRHLQVSVTAEASDAKRTLGANARDYYHAIRYIRFHQHLEQTQSPLWLVDVDARFNRDPLPLLRSLTSYDVALRANVAFLPWDKMPAALVGVSPTPAGRAFARQVATYISYWHNGAGLRWGIDQMALFAAYAGLMGQGVALKTNFLQDDAVGRGSDSVVRFYVGESKFNEAPV